MRVVHVGLEAPTARAGGLNRYLVELLGAQRAEGLDAAAVVLGDRDDADRMRAEGVVLAGPTSAGTATRSIRIERALRALGPFDVADLHFAGTAVLATVAGALRRTPTVVHFQGPWADESASSGSSRVNVAAKRAIERAVYRRADRFVVLSSAFGELLQRRYAVAPWSISVVAPGVDLVRFSPGDRGAARSRVGAAQGRVVLAVRRLVPRMGIEVLLEAWRALGPAPEDQLAVVGEGPSAEGLHRAAEALGVAATVRFCGAVDDDTLVAWYRAADATVVPSVSLEGFGLVVLESLACGTPVVGTDAGGLGEAIEMLGQGPAVRAGDAVALARGLEQVLARGDQTAACRAAAERHGWGDVALRHRAIYDEVRSGVERLRVVVLDHTAVLSGGELAIARALEGVRATASVHTILGADGPLRARLIAAGSTVEIMDLDVAARDVRREDVRPSRLRPAAILSTLRYTVRLARRLRELRPDVVHTNSLKAALYGGVAARLAGVPCVWHVRDRIEAPYLPDAAVRVVRRAARVLPSVVIANSGTTLATVGVPVGRVVSSPLDSSISPQGPRRGREGPVRFVVIGRLAEWKGQRLAIEAFADAFPSREATLRVVGAAMFGEDEYAASLPKLATELGVSDRVEFAGFVDDIASELARCDVVVHASLLAEPFGQVVIEAMGAGCAVVVADRGGPAEVVTDGLDAVVYPMGDRAALASAMRRVAEDPSLRERLGERAVRTASRFTPAALAPELFGAWAAARDSHPRRRRHTRG